jgi:N4-gp56 family major capsid protein
MASSGVSLVSSTAAQYAAVQEHAEKMIIKRLEIGVTDLHSSCVKRPIPKNNGRIVRWTRPGNFGIAQLATEGAAPTAVAVSAYTLTATVKQRTLVSTQSDIWTAASVAGVVNDLIPNMRYSIRLSMDVVIRNVMLIGKALADTINNLSTLVLSGNYGLPQVFAVGEHGSIGAVSTVMSANVLTVADIRRAVNELKNQDCPTFEDGFYRLYIHPTAASQLRKDTEYQGWNQPQRVEKFEKGIAGMVEGAKIIESSNMFWSSSGTATTGTVSAFYSILLGQGSTGVSEFQNAGKLYIVKGADKNDPLDMWTSIGYKFAVASTILNKSCGRVLVSTGLANTYPPAPN